MRRALALFLIVLAWTSVAWSNEWFWSHFSDGRAEVNGYQLTQPRYGELRRGHSVMIFVTEPFSRARGVKVDRYDAQNPDHFIALKLNHLRHFRTGVYDYAIMTSVFSDPSKDMRTEKVTFGAQEWCGLTWEKSRWTQSKTQLNIDSYFEGESTQVELKGVKESGDAVWTIARGLIAGGPGQATMSAPILGSATTRHLKHLPARTHDAQFRWRATEDVSVPAGQFRTRKAEWTRADSIQCSMNVEIPTPHRIISWRCSDGEAGQLTGSQRIAYWQKSRLGDEVLLKALGLPSRSSLSD